MILRTNTQGRSRRRPLSAKKRPLGRDEAARDQKGVLMKSTSEKCLAYFLEAELCHESLLGVELEPAVAIPWLLVVDG